MRIKEFVLCDSTRKMEERFKKGIIIEPNGRITHNYSDDEIDLACNLLVQGYKAFRKNIGVTEVTDDDVTSETAHMKVIGFLENSYEIKKCLFISSDNFSEGGSITYLNLNRKECIDTISKLKKIRNRIYIIDAKSRIKYLFLCFKKRVMIGN